MEATPQVQTDPTRRRSAVASALIANRQTSPANSVLEHGRDRARAQALRGVVKSGVLLADLGDRGEEIAGDDVGRPKLRAVSAETKTSAPAIRN